MELGTIAAAVQFVDLGCRSLSAIYRFVKDLKDVPVNLLLTLEDLSHFSGFMDELQTAIKTNDPRFRSLTPAQLDRATRILDSTGEVYRQLEALLAPCRPSAVTPQTKTSKAWRAFVSVKREKDIVRKCERLERLKHDLDRELLLSFKWV